MQSRSRVETLLKVSKDVYKNSLIGKLRCKQLQVLSHSLKNNNQINKQSEQTISFAVKALINSSNMLFYWS